MAVYNVATAAELTGVLSKLTGGDTVLLAAGNYGNVSFYQKNYASTVTVAAASNTGTVHFDGLTVASSSNLTFKGLDLGRGLAAGEPDYTKLNTVQNSSNVKLINVSIHGSLDGDVTNDGIGLFVTDAQNVEVLNSGFNELVRGVLVQRTTNITLGSSRFEGIRSDGANFAASDQVTIRGNVFKEFNRFGSDHPDAIQFWNTGQTKGQSDIVIKDNVFLPQEAGKGAQGIFIWDPGIYGYKNVLIQNNLMYGNDDYNGITVGGATNLRVIGNTILSSTLDAKRYWIRLEASQSVELKNNVTDHLLLKADLVGLVNENNLLVDNAAARERFLDLNTPLSVNDLIVSGVGYQLPDRGAVAKVLGSSLSGAFAGGQAFKSSQDTVLRDLDFGSTGGELVFETFRTAATLPKTSVSGALGDLFQENTSTQLSAAAPDYRFVDEALATPSMTSERFWQGFDHFVALP